MTDHQKKVLLFIRQFQEKERVSPSSTDITKYLGNKSNNGAWKTVRSLEKLGAIELDTKSRIRFPIGTILPLP